MLSIYHCKIPTSGPVKGRSVYSQCHCDVYNSLERSLPTASINQESIGNLWELSQLVGAQKVQAGKTGRSRGGTLEGRPVSFAFAEIHWHAFPLPRLQESFSPAIHLLGGSIPMSGLLAPTPGLGILTRYFCLGKVLSLQPPFYHGQREDAMCCN